MPLSGDPDAVLAAADDLDGVARTVGAVHEAMTAHGRSVTVDWSGLAAPLALTRIESVADDVRRARDAITSVVGPLRTYADELRGAQQDFLLGEQQARTSPDGRLLMESAAERALVANEAVTRVFRAAADGLPGGAPTPTEPTGADAALAEGGNLAASLGNAALRHPASAFAVAGGGILAALSAVGVVGGTAATATGVGSPAGVPMTGASVIGVTAGVGLAGAGALDLSQHALGDDRVAPFQVNADVSELPFDPPGEITGMTEHGRLRANGRDGGTGVSDEAMADAVANPTSAPVPQANGTYRYEGKDAVVSLNERGEVVTTWAATSNGWRNER
jgi:hypothetical protein